MQTRRWLAFAFVLSSCRSVPTAQPQAPAAPMASREPSLATRWVMRSAEYRAACLQAFRYALEHVSRAAAERKPGTWAVILDADETVISNARFQEEEETSGRAYSETAWSDWVRREEAEPIPGSKAFLARVHELGGKLVIVTNRSEADCPATEAVFRKHSLIYDAMLCKPKDQPQKDPRFERVIHGEAAPGLPPLEVVAWLGDNIRDFPGGSQDWRKKEESLGDFGTRYFVVPNPMYGSWDKLPN